MRIETDYLEKIFDEALRGYEPDYLDTRVLAELVMNRIDKEYFGDDFSPVEDFLEDDVNDALDDILESFDQCDYPLDTSVDNLYEEYRYHARDIDDFMHMMGQGHEEFSCVDDYVRTATIRYMFNDIDCAVGIIKRNAVYDELSHYTVTVIIDGEASQKHESFEPLPDLINKWVRWLEYEYEVAVDVDTVRDLTVISCELEDVGIKIEEA